MGLTQSTAYACIYPKKTPFQPEKHKLQRSAVPLTLLPWNHQADIKMRSQSHAFVRIFHIFHFLSRTIGNNQEIFVIISNWRETSFFFNVTQKDC